MEAAIDCSEANQKIIWTFFRWLMRSSSRLHLRDNPTSESSTSVAVVRRRLFALKMIYQRLRFLVPILRTPENL